IMVGAIAGPSSLVLQLLLHVVADTSAGSKAKLHLFSSRAFADNIDNIDCIAAFFLSFLPLSPYPGSIFCVQKKCVNITQPALVLKGFGSCRSRDSALLLLSMVFFHFTNFSSFFCGIRFFDSFENGSHPSSKKAIFHMDAKSDLSFFILWLSEQALCRRHTG